MKKSTILLMLAAAMIGCGAFAEEPGPAPKDSPRGPEAREGHRRRQQHPDFARLLKLSDQDKAAVKTAEESFKAAVKPIKEKALEDAKKAAATAFDARLKIYKEAAAKLTDAKEKEKAEKMLTRMENNRDRAIEMMAKRSLMPDRPMRGPRDGQRGRREGQRGDRPMPPPEN